MSLCLLFAGLTLTTNLGTFSALDIHFQLDVQSNKPSLGDDVLKALQ